jgi:hypothetical protein
VTIGASASDNVAVVGVQFKIDGTNAGAEDTSSPYTATWNTTVAANGGHVITATARDAAGNTSVATIAVTVSNAVVVATQTLFPATYTVSAGSQAAGNVASLNSDNNNYLAIRSVWSGLSGVSRTDFEFSTVQTSSRLEFTVIAKSSSTSTALRLYAFNYSTNAWVQIHSSTISTSETTRAVTISSNAASYRSSAGRARLRAESVRSLATPTMSYDLIRLVARN